MQRPLGLFLALWIFGFACLHMAWAAGARWWVPAEVGSIFARPWFLAYDLVAGLLMIGASWVAARLALGDRTRWLRTAALVGSILALFRGLPPIFGDIVSVDYAGLSFFADVWFTVAGLSGLALWRVTRLRSEE